MPRNTAYLLLSQGFHLYEFVIVFFQNTGTKLPKHWNIILHCLSYNSKIDILMICMCKYISHISDELPRDFLTVFQELIREALD